MKPQIKTIITYLLLLLFVSGCGTPKINIPISEIGVIQEVCSAPELSQPETSTGAAGNTTEDTELSTEDTEYSAKQLEKSTESTTHAQAFNENQASGSDQTSANGSDKTGIKTSPANTGNQINPAGLTSSMSKLLLPEFLF